MPDIDPVVIEHRLNIDPTCKPVALKNRHIRTERRAAAIEEVHKLLEVDFIWECQYPEWISNVVLIKKSNGTWHMCIDSTDLS